VLRGVPEWDAQKGLQSWPQDHLQPRPATQANYRNLLSRYDIADYLAVSVETASRSLTDLKHRGVIKLTGTRIVMIVNRNALEDGERTRLAA
jgi:DNA-binding transcriptional regulator YhcF (GntR family)